MAGNPLINSMTNPKNQSSPFGQYGAGGTYSANTAPTQNYGNYQNTGYAQPTQNYGQNQSASELNNMYNAPAATNYDTGRITMNDVVQKTAIVFGAILIGATAGWFIPALMIIGAIGGLVLGLVNSFKKEVSPVLVLLYGLLQGMALGGISSYYELRFPGIVGQAVLATLIVFAVVLVLFRSGKVRATPKLTKIFMIASISYLIFIFVNLGLGLFTGTNMRSIEVGGVPLGLIIGLLATIMATYSLVLDFTHISDAVRTGAPERESWRLAFGLAVTLVWLYIEILRIIGYIRAMADN